MSDALSGFRAGLQKSISNPHPWIGSAHPKSRFQTSGEFADLTIRSQDGDHLVHKVIVCAQSPVFAALCTSGFKVRQTKNRERFIWLELAPQESKDNVIDLSGEPPHLISRLVEFMYHFKYANIKKEESSTATNQRPRYPREFIDIMTNNLSLHIDMYAIADRFLLTDLAKYAASRYAWTLGVSKGEDPWAVPIPAFLATVRKVYEVTPESDKVLRGIAIKTTCLCCHLFMREAEDKKQFRAVLGDVPQLAWDLVVGKSVRDGQASWSGSYGRYIRDEST